MDSPPHGQRERIQHPLFAGDRRHANHAADQWRTQATGNRQGSGELLPHNVGEQLSAAETEFQAQARRLYEDRIAAGVAREQARKDLPLSTYTEAYWKVDLHNLLHFLALRMDSHAQEEIRAYATAIGQRNHAAAVPAGVGSVCRLPPGSHLSHAPRS